MLLMLSVILIVVGGLTSNNEMTTAGVVILLVDAILGILAFVIWAWFWVFNTLLAQSGFGGAIGWGIILWIASIPLIILVYVLMAALLIVIGSLIDVDLIEMIPPFNK